MSLPVRNPTNHESFKRRLLEDYDEEQSFSDLKKRWDCGQASTKKSSIRSSICLGVLVVLMVGTTTLAACTLAIISMTSDTSAGRTTSVCSTDHMIQSQNSEKIYSVNVSEPPTGKDSSGAKYLMQDPCGNTPAAAITSGCRFSMMDYAWLPEQCYDEELEEQFRDHTDWKMYLYPNRTGRISWEDAQRGQYTYLMVQYECEYYPVCKSTI